MADELPEVKKEFVRLADLKPWAKNPRTVTPEGVERLKHQITELNNGKPYKPLLVNQDNIVLGGNQRYKAYHDLKIDPVEVSRVFTKDESEMYKYALSDNDHIGTTDMEQLLREMPNLDIDWKNYAIDLNNSVLITTLQKYSSNDLLDEWKGMPEFNQEDQQGIKQIIVTFKTMEDYAEFAKLINQNLTKDTKSIWFPAAERADNADKKYEE